MTDATLATWRLPPHNVWAFRHVDRLIPVAAIPAAAAAPLPAGPAIDADAVRIPFEGRNWALADALAATATDGLIVLRDGRVAYERYCNGDAAARHILFSVSKSVTGLLAGILAAEGRLDPEAPVTRYVPEVAGSAYGTATVRHVLDMTVDVGFVEDYLDSEGAFARYRAATGWNPPNPRFGGEGLHGFLATLPRAGGAHGHSFHYVSPNSDLLGWIVERAAGQSFAAFAAARLWQPMGAEHDAYVTVDAYGAARAAGGVCTSLRDLARLGELVRCGGRVDGRQVVPADWIDDIWRNGDAAAWQRGSMAVLFPRGSYRSQWYASDRQPPRLCAIGIHGQWICIAPETGAVAVKQSSQPLPVDDRTDRLTVALLAALCAV